MSFYNHVQRAWIGATMVVGSAFLSVAPAAAQVESQLSIAATKQWANVDRYLNPAGVTAGFTVFPVPLVSVRVTWTQLSGSSEYSQLFCSGLNCSQEPATHQTAVQRVEFGAAINPRLSDRWRLSLGVGVGGNSVHASGSSLTSGRPETGMLTTTTYGTAFWVGADRPLTQSGRVGASIEIHRTLSESLGGCATDVATPFCHTLRATSIRLGLHVKLVSEP